VAGLTVVLEREELGVEARELTHVRNATRMREVPIRDSMIRLGQLLKLAGLAESGADAKALLREGAVTVNGEVESRRGRQLARGDVVTVGEEAARVA